MSTARTRKHLWATRTDYVPPLPRPQTPEDFEALKRDAELQFELFDTLPPEWRELICEFGLHVGEAYDFFLEGVTAAQLRAGIETYSLPVIAIDLNVEEPSND